MRPSELSVLRRGEESLRAGRQDLLLREVRQGREIVWMTADLWLRVRPLILNRRQIAIRSRQADAPA